MDIMFRAQVEDIKSHSAKLEEFAVNFEAIAIVNSMLIENINMQMEGEIADLLDRRMMSLYGISEKQASKLDVQNTSKRLQAAQHITQSHLSSVTPRHERSMTNPSMLAGDSIVD